MRAIATINLSFGLLNIPLKVASMTEQQIGFKNICPKCESDIKYKRVCTKCENEVPFNELKKAFQVSKDYNIPIDREDIKKLSSMVDKTAQVLTMVNQIDIPLVAIDKSYYLLPVKHAEKSFAILEESLKAEKKGMVIEFALRSRRHIGTIHFWKSNMVLTQLLYPEQLRKPPEVEPIKLMENEVSMAKDFLKDFENRTKDTLITNMKDSYRVAIEKLITDIEEKRKAKPIEKVTN